MQVWKNWSYGAVTSLTSMYGVGGSPPERGVVTWGTARTTVDYPPATLYGLALVGRAYRLLDPAFADTVALTVVIKLSILLADALLCVAVWSLATRLGGRTAGYAAAAFYWCNPASIMDGAVLGYLDPWAGAAAVAALVAAADGSAVLCGALLALAAMTKVQAIFVAPVAAWLLWRSARKPTNAIIAGAGAGLAAGAVLLAPYALRGALPNVTQGVLSLLRHDMLSGTAANLWWIVTYVLRASYAVHDLGAWGAWTMTVRILGVSRVVALGYPNPRPIATVLTVAVMAWGFWQARRSGSPLAIVAAGAFAIHAYFTLAVQVHENHLFLALPLIAVAAASVPTLAPVLAAISAIFTLNLFLFYGIGRGFPSPPRNLTVVDATVLLSVVNVIALAWHARRLRHAAYPAAVHGNRGAGHV